MELKEKVIKVIKSCNNFEQLKTAADYMLLSFKKRKFTHDDYNEIIQTYFTKKLMLL